MWTDSIAWILHSNCQIVKVILFETTIILVQSCWCFSWQEIFTWSSLCISIPASLFPNRGARAIHKAPFPNSSYWNRAFSAFSNSKSSHSLVAVHLFHLEHTPRNYWRTDIDWHLRQPLSVFPCTRISLSASCSLLYELVTSQCPERELPSQSKLSTEL